LNIVCTVPRMMYWYVEPTLTYSKCSLHMLSILQHVLAHHMCHQQGVFLVLKLSVDHLTVL